MKYKVEILHVYENMHKRKAYYHIKIITISFYLNNLFVISLFYFIFYILNIIFIIEFIKNKI